MEIDEVNLLWHTEDERLYSQRQQFTQGLLLHNNTSQSVRKKITLSVQTLATNVVVSEIEGYSYSLLYNRNVSTIMVLVVYRVITELLDVDTGIVL